MTDAQLRELIGHWHKSAGETRGKARCSADGLTSLKLYVVSDMMELLASDLAQILDQQTQAPMSE